MISAVVPLPTPDLDKMIEALDHLTERVKAGEFVTLLIAAFKDDGDFISCERGKRMSRLEMVGILESWKADLLQAMETNKPVQI